MIEPGEAVGAVGAQSLSEPGEKRNYRREMKESKVEQSGGVESK